MIRNGTESDIPRIVEMASEFWAHTIYEEPACGESIASMAKFCIGQGLMAVLEINDKVSGFCCGVRGPVLGNNSSAAGTEIAWWIDPEHRAGSNGIKLLKYTEDLARAAGVKYWNMAYMESSMPDHIKSIYEKLGYKKTEVIYSRVL